MRRLIGVVVTALATSSVVVSAQSGGGVADGIIAYTRGDYQRAAELLQPFAERDPGGNPAAQLLLGGMYEEGRGVPQDPLRACALYHRAANHTEQPFGMQAGWLMRAIWQRLGQEFFQDCQLISRLGFDHRFEPVTFDLGAGHSIAWTLKGATVSYQGKTSPHQVFMAERGAAFLPLRYTPLTSPGPAGRVRHFVELFLWVPGGRDGWNLQWHLFEVVGSELIRVADQETVATSTTRPPAATSEDVRQRVAVRTNIEGGTEWVILEGPQAGAHPIESLEERREVRETSAARDAALKNVDWKRRVDARRLPSLTYTASDGCSSVFVYAFTQDRAEAISLRADRAALQLSTTARSFDLARHPDAITLNVSVYSQPLRQVPLFCSDVGGTPSDLVTEVWRAVAGTVTIELSKPGIRAKEPALYRATIRIEGAELIDSSGRRHRQTTPIVLSAIVGAGQG